MEIVLVLVAALLVAYFNGANDNFKGVATLLGSRTTNYRAALRFATAMTFLGSLAAISFAKALVKKFSGAGLVPDAVAVSPEFISAVALAAGATLLAATLLGLPVSTTHALTGALLGAAWSSGGTGPNLGYLYSNFFHPLLYSPLVAVAGSALVYPVFRYLRIRAGIDKETCLCMGSTVLEVVSLPSTSESVFTLPQVELMVAPGQFCVERYRGRALGLPLQKVLDNLHYFSAGAVSFARGLNDTPKIVALLVSAQFLGLNYAVPIVGLLMAAGALLQARKVATTLSYRITGMNHGQGFTANLITSGLVILASRWGLPVSTTHVSCGALFGIGLVTGQARYRTILHILSAWLCTLPISAFLAFCFGRLLQ